MCSRSSLKLKNKKKIPATLERSFVVRREIPTNAFSRFDFAKLHFCYMLGASKEFTEPNVKDRKLVLGGGNRGGWGQDLRLAALLLADEGDRVVEQPKDLDLHDLCRGVS